MLLFNKNNAGEDEIHSLAAWTAGHAYETLVESLLLAIDWLTNILGEDVVAELDGFYRNPPAEPTPTSTAQAAAVELAQRAVINMAFKFHAPKAAVHFDNTGVSVKWSEDYRPAQQEMVPLLTSLKKTAFAFLDQLLRAFRKSPAAFPAWKDTAQFSDLLIQTPAMLSHYIQIESASATYFVLAPHMRRVQQTEVAAAVGELWPDLFFACTKLPHLPKGTVASPDMLPVGGSPICILVQSERAYYQYFDDAWQRVAWELGEMTMKAQQIVATDAYRRHRLQDLAELRDALRGTKEQKTEVAAFLAEELTYVRAMVEALTAQARIRLEEIARVLSPALPPAPVEVSEDYFSTPNSFVL